MHQPNLQPQRIHPQRLSLLLLLSLTILALTLSACSDDSGTGEAQGADVGGSCIDASDCVRGLLCIGRVCTDPNNPNTSGGATADNNGTNGGVITGGGTAATSNGTTNAQTTSNGTTVNNTGGTTSTGGGTTNPDGDCIAGQDQDGDGIDDAVEGSDDSDQDGLVNCLDTDSDNDGLTDAEETALGTDPTFNDSDRDRASDLLEWAAGTALDDPQDQPENAILIVVDADEQEVSRQFEFSSQVQRSDVYILMDTSTTMDGEIENLKRTLVTSILPDIRARVPDTWFGVGHYDDFDLSPYGNNPDFRPYAHLQDITEDDNAVINAINGLTTCCTLGDGQTFPESATVALWGLSTTQGFGRWIPPRGECPGKGAIGYPCFRPDALPVVVLITDASFHNGPGGADPYTGIIPPPPIFTEATAALNAIGAKVLGIVSGSSGLTHVRTTAQETGAVNAQNQPLVYEVSSNGMGLDTRITEAVQELTGNVRRDVSVDPTDPDEDDTFDPTPHVRDITTVLANPLDGIQNQSDTTFFGVIPGTTLRFEVAIARAGIVAEPAQGQHQVVHVLLRVLGDGTVLLDERNLYIVFAREGATIDL